MNITNFKIEEVGFNEIELPPILYKYRDWNDINHRRLLTENEIYLSSPSDFKDEFDCKIPIRYDLLTESEICKRHYTKSKINNPHFNRNQHREFVRNLRKNGLMINKMQLSNMNERYFEIFNEYYSIFSLTAIPDNLEMWRDYSNGHTGFCCGFNSNLLCNLTEYFGGGGEVVYFDELPIIKPTDCFEKKNFLQIHSKLRKWKFEKEYRLTKCNIKDRKVKIPNNVYTEVILGAKIDTKSKNEIIEIVERRFPNATILSAKLEENQIRFENISTKIGIP